MPTNSSDRPTRTYCRYHRLQHAQNLQQTHQAAAFAAIHTYGADTAVVHPARAGGAGAGAVNGGAQAVQASTPAQSTGCADVAASSDYDPDEDGGDDVVLDPGPTSANVGPYYAESAKPSLAAPAPVADAPPVAPLMPPPLVMPSGSF